jgi:hypothetical protein
MRIRTIKPEFWTDEKIGQIDPWARLMFIGLWNMVDEYGLMEWSPMRIQATLFPYNSDLDCDELGRQLIEQGMIFLYEHEKKMYLCVKHFRKHQKVSDQVSPRHPLPPNGQLELAGFSHDESEKNPTSRKKILRVGKKSSGTGTGTGTGTGKGGRGGKKRRKKKVVDQATLELCGIAFDAFWDAYPRKQGKEEAWDSFCKHECHQLMDTILPALAKHKKTPQWLRDAGQYIPYPATWLNNQRWEDDLTIETADSASKRPCYKRMGS